MPQISQRMRRREKLVAPYIFTAERVMLRRASFDVPQEVRSLGPWSVISRGGISELLAEHRVTLAKQGYLVIGAHMLGFEKRLKAL